MSFFSQQHDAIVSEPSPYNLEYVHHEELYKQLAEQKGDVEYPTFAAYLYSTSSYIYLPYPYKHISLAAEVSDNIIIKRMDAHALTDALADPQASYGVCMFYSQQIRPPQQFFDAYYYKLASLQKGQTVYFVFYENSARVAFIDLYHFDYLISSASLLFYYVYCRVLLYLNACERAGCESIFLALPQASEQLVLIHAICAALTYFKQYENESTVTLYPFGRYNEYLLRLILPVYFPRNEKEERLRAWQRFMPLIDEAAKPASTLSGSADSTLYDDSPPLPANLLAQIQKLLQQQEIYEGSFVSRHTEQSDAERMLERRAREYDLLRVINMYIVQVLRKDTEYLMLISAFKLQSIRPSDSLFWELSALLLRYVGLEAKQPIRIIWCTGSNDLCLFVQTYYNCFPERFRQRLTKVFVVRPQGNLKSYFMTPELQELYPKLACYYMLDEVRAELDIPSFSAEVVQWDSRFK